MYDAAEHKLTLTKASALLQVKNSSGEDVREGVYVSSAEEHELAGSKGTANFVIKWVRDARNQANLNVVEDMKKVVFKYTGTAFPPQAVTPSSLLIHRVTCDRTSSKQRLNSCKIVFRNAADDEGKFAPLVAFECRGLDPIEWHPEVRDTVVCAVCPTSCMPLSSMSCRRVTAGPCGLGRVVSSWRTHAARSSGTQTSPTRSGWTSTRTRASP